MKCETEECYREAKIRIKGCYGLEVEQVDRDVCIPCSKMLSFLRGIDESSIEAVPLPKASVEKKNTEVE